MTRYKAWLIKKYGMVVFCGILAVCLYNYMLDPYGVLRRDLSGPRPPPNQSFLKVDHVLSNPTKFDSFIFGSSRVGTINPLLIPGGRYYNMTSAGAIPLEHLYQIRLFLDKGIRIKNVMIGLCEQSYLLDPSSIDISPLMKPHYLITHDSFLKFFSFYLFRKPSTLELFYYTNPERLSEYDIYGTGMHYRRDIEAAIEKDVEGHVNQWIFQWHVHEGDRTEAHHYLEGVLEDIGKIVELSRQHCFDLTFFVHPIHRTSYLNMDLGLFFSFLRKLATITNFYDFSGINSITTDNYYHYELTHYRPLVGEMIIAEIWDEGSAQVPEDFGVLVTRDNVDRHLEEKKRRLDQTGYRRDSSSGTRVE